MANDHSRPRPRSGRPEDTEYYWALFKKAFCDNDNLAKARFAYAFKLTPRKMRELEAETRLVHDRQGR